MNKYILIITMLLGGFVPVSQAELPARITVGMTQADVFKVRGEPVAKDEHETSRKIIWTYKDGAVVFHNGKVVDAKTQLKKHAPLGMQAQSQKPKAKKGTGEDLSQQEVDDIIAAIPNDTGKPSPNNDVTGGASSQ